jgi:signal transduction histidine kinase
VKHSHLTNFRSLEGETFTPLMRHLGFASAVVYRLSGEALVKVIGTEGTGESDWPVAVSFTSNYTSAAAGSVPRGWVRVQDLPINRKFWPKAVNLYFPEQEMLEPKLVFAVVNAAGKRSRTGELSGPLEAIAARIRGWFVDQLARQEFSEAGIREHIKTLSIDLTMLIDHELRTPLASVTGYTSLLKDTNRTEQPEVWEEYFQVLEQETGAALDAVEKLSLALHSGAPLDPQGDMASFDAADEIRSLSLKVQEQAIEIAGQDFGRKIRVNFQKATDLSCVIQANANLFRWATWEVLKNAVHHSRGGKVDVAVYTSDRMLVVDVADDGPGVSPGSEELIFLRFYQDPGSLKERHGKRGLGLGLFLARHIVERHLGQLTFIRNKNGSLFRFIWPFKVLEMKRSS